MSEHQVEQWARRLGGAAAERLDVEATARAVAERLRAAPAAPTPARWGAAQWLRVAAALALLLGTGAVLQRLQTPQAAPAYALAALHDLTTSELTQLLEGLDDTLIDDAPDLGAPDFDTLTPEQLQALLRSLET